MEIFLLLIIAFITAIAFLVDILSVEYCEPPTCLTDSTSQRDFDAQRVREYLGKRGELYATDTQLKYMWEKFSEEECDAEWESVDPDSLELFMKFIDK